MSRASRKATRSSGGSSMVGLVLVFALLIGGALYTGIPQALYNAWKNMPTATVTEKQEEQAAISPDDVLRAMEAIGQFSTEQTTPANISGFVKKDEVVELGGALGDLLGKEHNVAQTVLTYEGASVRIKAGFDFKAHKPRKVVVDGNNVTVYLPAPEVLDKYVVAMGRVDVQTSGVPWVFDPSEEEKQAMRTTAEADVIEKVAKIAIEIGLLRLANTSAEEQLPALAHAFGVPDNINIKFVTTAP